MTRIFAFLALAVTAVSSFAATPTVESLPSGVIVEHIKAGSGAQPKATDTVTVNYRGVLETGQEFDSSYKRGVPASFPLYRVVPCWTEGIQHLKVGSKAKLTCPSTTAYGAAGVPGVIPQNAKLTFEVELLGIK